METRRTPLYDFHLANSARMVPFAGWDMPVQYADGIKAEHLATRTGAGLFDVSHMAQIWLAGGDADAALERLTPTDVGAITEGRIRYSLLLDDNGGVLDDLMIARLDGDLQLVVNAGRADHDIAHLRANLRANPTDNVKMTVRDDRALLALQGPESPQVLRRLGVDLDGFFFMQIGHFTIDGVDCIITRSGYTGEDGFEISIPSGKAVQLAELLCDDAAVSLAGLGARDTLRLEAGLPLWGHELDETINPVAAGLRFALAKRRREAADCPGAAAIMPPGITRVWSRCTTADAGWWLKSLDTSGRSFTSRTLPMLAPDWLVATKSVFSASASMTSRGWKTRSTADTFGVGTRIATPSSLPASSGRTSPTACAAPVVEGTMFSAAARAR